MTRVIVRPSAEADVAEASEWYDARVPGLGTGLLEEVRGVLARVRDTPLHFPTVGDDVRRALLQRFPYAIYFISEDERRIVIAVLHQRRRPGTWRRRLRDERR